MGNKGSKIYKVLDKTEVCDVVEMNSENIKKVSCNNTVAELLLILRENRINAVPLWDEKSQQYRGLIDVGDLVAYLGSFRKKSDYFFDELRDAFLQSPISAKLADFSHLNFCSSVKQQDNLLRVVRCLSGDDHLQRVIVLDEKNNIGNIIGQGLVLRFLRDNCKLIKTSRFQNISKFAANSLNIPAPVSKEIYAKDLQSKRGLLSVSDTDSALNAFYYLTDNKIRSAPIISQDGKILGNLSTSDITGLTEETWHLLDKPVLEYLKGINRYKEPVVVTPNSKLKNILKLLHDNSVHHVYVVNEGKTEGVISVSDVLSYVKKLSSPMGKAI